VVSNTFSDWPFWHTRFWKNSGLHLQIFYWILGDLSYCYGDVPKFGGFSGGEVSCHRQTLSLHTDVHEQLYALCYWFDLDNRSGTFLARVHS